MNQGASASPEERNLVFEQPIRTRHPALLGIAVIWRPLPRSSVAVFAVDHIALGIPPKLTRASLGVRGEGAALRASQRPTSDEVTQPVPQSGSAAVAVETRVHLASSRLTQRPAERSEPLPGHHPVDQ